MYSLESDPETFAGRFRTGVERQEMDWRWLMESKGVRCAANNGI